MIWDILTFTVVAGAIYALWRHYKKKPSSKAGCNTGGVCSTCKLCKSYDFTTESAMSKTMPTNMPSKLQGD